jgi:predicted amidohydrolase YtcJ
MRYGVGDEFLRVAGVKIFADGSLGSQTALCFNKYPGSDNKGIEVTSPDKLKKLVNSAARLGLPSAIHAIGDLAVSNVLDAFESAPKLKSTARHRVEHLQLVRRRDIARLRKLGVVASMQPSHCPADIDLVAKYWPTRGRNTYIFRTLTERGIPLAFGSDAPIESLNPLAGIAAAVQRSRPGKRQVFYPEERISAQTALHNFTAGPAFAVGQEQSRGYLLPGYPADLVVLSDDITRVAASKIAGIEVLATILDGQLKYYRDELKF